jgi:hypothetical protein
MRISSCDIFKPVKNDNLGCMDEFMQAAIEEARKGLLESGIPIGSVLVRRGRKTWAVERGYWGIMKAC